MCLLSGENFIIHKKIQADVVPLLIVPAAGGLHLPTSPANTISYYQ
jgi:hypothetical protein